MNGVYCGRRAGKLYKAPSKNYFGCRHCYDLSYESRNESRLGMCGQLGYLLKAEKQYEELYKKTKRWTWRGRPTRKVRRLQALERKMSILSGPVMARIREIVVVAKHRLVTKVKDIPYLSIIIDRNMGVDTRGAYIRMTCGISDLCKRSTARKGMRDKRVAAVVNGQMLKPFLSKNPASGKKPLPEISC